MALPYFLSAQPYVYEHLISRALTSFFFFFFSPRPQWPPSAAHPPSWFLLALAAGPDPGCSGCSAGLEPMETSRRCGVRC